MISGIQGNVNISSDMMLQMREKMFSKTDVNGDGQIDQSEMSSFADQMAKRAEGKFNVEDVFTQGDTDGDGVLSKEEFMALRPPQPRKPEVSSEEMQQKQAELFAAIDQNGDGSIDESEMEEFASEMAARTGQSDNIENFFLEGDTNGDGVISEDEFMAMKPPKPPETEATLAYKADSQAAIGAELTGSLLDVMS
ncbi:MAG: EF-hand domain-containing protein [candidate division Zixibacteria bacterium]|nr:EF-hand domain-containing protein [candidate division Zixibacteria bacterium]